YTAIHHTALSLIPLHKLHRGYFFESDLLFRLSTIRGVVTDMPHRALYGSERSGISLLAAVPTFALKHLRNFLTRIFYNYYLRDFQLASLEWLLGPVLILFGLIFGTYQWIDHIQQQIEASAGTVMLSGLPLIVGLQMLLSAIGFDVDNQPRIPLQVRLDQATVSAQ
ncbi:MAG: glycosyltransferase family 2 protein, partial [Pseudomonadota bacterium]